MVVALAAIYGVSTWRRQLTGSTQFELARRTVFLGMKLRNEFSRARSPFTTSNESAGRVRDPKESQAVTQVLNEWYARDRRLPPLRETLDQLQEVGWEARLVLDPEVNAEIEAALKVFSSAFGNLASSVFSYFNDLESTAAGQTGSDKEWVRGLRDTVYGLDDDVFIKEIAEAVKRLESSLGRYTSSRVSPLTLLLTRFESRLRKR